MERVDPTALESTKVDDSVVRQRLAEPLGTEHLAINRYRVPPGAGIPGGLHTHLDQEEVFVVLAGGATFETLTDGEVTVGTGSAIRFAPGEYQSGRNDGDVDLEVLAIGAPRQAADTRIPFQCPVCGFHGLQLEPKEHGLVFSCPDCGANHHPAPCPACGDESLRTTIDEANDPLVVCDGCHATYESPPFET